MIRIRAPSRIIKDILDNLASVPNEYTDRYMPRWYKQPEYVEVWVEKNAMAGVMFAVLTESRHVRIVPNGGWASETYHHDNFIRLQAKKAVLDYELIKKYPDSPLQWSTGETRKVTVLYYGDYDPTGSRIVKNLERDSKEIGVNFERVAITKEQIIEYNLKQLKEEMTEDVKAKLRRDTNARAFMSENDDMLFQIELDALNALHPQDFISLLEGSVDKHFDESIYQEVLNDRIHSEKAIKRELRKQVKGFKI
jgi:hypothetical protein